MRSSACTNTQDKELILRTIDKSEGGVDNSTKKIQQALWDAYLIMQKEGVPTESRCIMA